MPWRGVRNFATRQPALAGQRRWFPTHDTREAMKTHSTLAFMIAWTVLVATPSAGLRAAEPGPAASDAGIITGSVSNVATRNLLEGAKVELPSLGLAVLTDNTGRFVVPGVPPGTHDVVASYIGLDAVRTQVSVTTGQRAVRDFELTSSIYKMDAFKVTGEREGDALALTAQRNAANVKNIVAMDSFGNLPNMSAGEVVMRLPGIAGAPTEEGLNYQFNVRGMAPALNTVTVDGGLMASIGTSRAFELQSISGTMFEQLELIKGHTPDRTADSLGGTINMKSRSPLSMRENRRISYSATVRFAPSFTEQIPAREERRSHPLLTLAYQEVFSVFGGSRNLGIAANLFYSENAVGGFRVTNQYEATTNPVAYLWSYQTRENYNNRKQASVNLKTDFRYSFNTKYSLNLTLNNNVERFRRSNNATAYTGNATTVPNATTSGVIPGYTDKVTQVRPIAGAMLDIVNNGPNSYVVKTFLADFGAEHTYGPLEIDYNVGYSRNHQASGTLPNGGQTALTHRVNNIGWIVDRTYSDTFPRFVQTAGPSVTDYNNYRPIANGLVKTTTDNPMNIPQARANVKYRLPFAVPATVKTGASWREQSVDFTNFSRRWSYIGTSPLVPDPVARPYNNLKTGVNLPRWKTSDFLSGGTAGKEPKDPSLWREDLYFFEANKYSGTRSLSEAVTAGYIMAQGSFGREGWLGRSGYLGGVRTERTGTEGNGWVLARANTRSTAAQQVADPAGSARRDYVTRDSEGSYTKSFPSIHLTHDFTRNLRARTSWSTSFGRPALSNLLPSESANENAQTLTINNPALKPQTAKNWDVTLDYYFEPVGSVSAAWFKKTIREYIVTGTQSGIVGTGNDNGFNGDYAGFTILRSSNAGTAEVTGWELSYQQQFTFLPGLLRGLSGSANYTKIETEGNFGESRVRKTGEVPGFIPRAANVSLSWRYRGFSARVLYNYTGSYITSYSANNPGANIYRETFETVNIGVAYQIRPSLTITCDVANVFNEAQRYYQAVPGRTQDLIYNFVTITAGVSGRF
jgi:iron complex outermembrane receptor protein